MSFAMKMPPNHHHHHLILNGIPVEPVSRTYQYRKIMKPMLERKRRARINKCLDELKDLMTGTLQANGENVSKLEKADILELTVRHLHRLRENNALFTHYNEAMNMDKFLTGFQHCITEVSQFLNKHHQNINGDLFKYIANYMPNIEAQAALAAVNNVTPTTAAAATTSTLLALHKDVNTLPMHKPIQHTTALHRFSLNDDDKVINVSANQRNIQLALNRNLLPLNQSTVKIEEIHSDSESLYGGMDTGGIWRPW